MSAERTQALRLTATAAEMGLALEEMSLRVRRHEIRDLSDHFEPEDRERIDFYQPLAEILFARHKGIAWQISRSPRRQNRLLPYRVHWTDHEDGHLIVAPGETALIHVLAVGPATDPRTLDFVGHITLDEAKALPLRKGKAPGRWVPQESLHPFGAASPTA